MFKRVRFFAGKLITAQDLQAEGEYHLSKRRYLNRYLFGSGIVAGLDLTPDKGSITVSPGLAIDATGNEIVLDSPAFVDMTLCTSTTCLVLLRYAEAGSDPVPVGDGRLEFSRTSEGYLFELRAEGEDTADAVCLGRAVKGEDGWTLDEGYARQTVRRGPDSPEVQSLT